MRKLWWMMGPLRDAAGDGSGSGGGSGAGAGSGGAAFDPAAFQTALMTEVNKTINGALKGLKTDFTRALDGLRSGSGSGSGDGSGSGSGDGSGDGSGSGGSGSGAGSGKQPDPHVAKLQRQLDDLNKQLTTERTARETATKEASEKERLAAIREALANHTFGSDGYRADAFRLFRDEIKRGEDGELYGGDNIPMKDFIAEMLKARTDWAPAKEVSGAGARSGKTATGKAFDLNDIKPGMKPEEVAAAAQHIQAALQGQA